MTYKLHKLTGSSWALKSVTTPRVNVIKYAVSLWSLFSYIASTQQSKYLCPLLNCSMNMLPAPLAWALQDSGHRSWRLARNVFLSMHTSSPTVKGRSFTNLYFMHGLFIVVVVIVFVTTLFAEILQYFLLRVCFYPIKEVVNSFILMLLFCHSLFVMTAYILSLQNASMADRTNRFTSIFCTEEVAV